MSVCNYCQLSSCNRRTSNLYAGIRSLDARTLNNEYQFTFEYLRHVFTLFIIYLVCECGMCSAFISAHFCECHPLYGDARTTYITRFDLNGCSAGITCIIHFTVKMIVVYSVARNIIKSNIIYFFFSHMIDYATSNESKIAENIYSNPFNYIFNFYSDLCSKRVNFRATKEQNRE